MEAVEKHFRETHKDNIIKAVDTHTLNGAAARALRSPDLVRLVRNVWEDQRRFPLQIATVLSQQFAGHGLQFFKVNRTLTHVCVARPHYLDMAETPVSEGVKQIVDYINTHPKCNRRQLVEALAPTPAPPAVETPVAEAQPAPTPESTQATPEQTAVIADLHWLVHQGHVIEFANGMLEMAKRPLPKPTKPEVKPAEKTVEPASQAETAPVTELAALEPNAASSPEPEPVKPAEQTLPPEPEAVVAPALISDAPPAAANEVAAVPVAAPPEQPS